MPSEIMKADFQLSPNDLIALMNGPTTTDKRFNPIGGSLALPAQNMSSAGLVAAAKMLFCRLAVFAYTPQTCVCDWRPFLRQGMRCSGTTW